jgi:iron complex outermembrane receptor protein
MRIRRLSLVTLLASASIFASPLADARNPNAPEDLAKLSLEDLMNIEVTSVSKKEQNIGEAAAAIYVLTQQDLRRTGATSIPEALRFVPGLDVAQIDAHTWAISSRGFNGQFANKMLVLVDGRSVYTPFFSGVYWDALDPAIEEIDRIEIIRGPGASIWGVNAVNGVIDIITKSASETTGLLLSSRGGKEGAAFGHVRYGDRLGASATYRVNADYDLHEGFVKLDGTQGADNFDSLHTGFRIDGGEGKADALTLMGGTYRLRAGSTITEATLAPPFSLSSDKRATDSGSFLLGRWKHVYSPSSDSSLQIYYDAFSRDEDIIGERRETVDLDYQHHLRLGDHNDLIAGVGYRATHDILKQTPEVSFSQTSADLHYLSAFVEDLARFAGDRVQVTVGAKAERAPFSGNAFEPSARLLWKATGKQSLWAAASRAVRNPSRAENDVRFNIVAFPGTPAPPNEIAAFGNPELGDEGSSVYELGYRFAPSPRLAFDLATFYNRYSDLTALEQGTPFLEITPAPVHVVIPLTFNNSLHGHSYGAELSGSFRASDRWQLMGWYSRTKVTIEADDPSTNPTPFFPANATPLNQYHLRSYLDMPGNLAYDASLTWVDQLGRKDSASTGSPLAAPSFIPAYLRLDMRLAWHRGKDFEASVGAQNLLDSKHQEFEKNGWVNPTEVERSVDLRLTWRH